MHCAMRPFVLVCFACCVAFDQEALWWVHSGGVHDPGCESDEIDKGAHTGTSKRTGDEGDTKTAKQGVRRGSSNTTNAWKWPCGCGCGLSDDGGVMTVGMLGALQSTMEGGVEHCLWVVG